MSRQADTAGERQDAIEPAKPGIPGFEAHDRPKIVKLGSNRLPGRKPRQDLGRAVPQAFARDHDACASIGLDHVAGPDVGGTIAAYNLPVGPAGQDTAVEFVAFDAAAQDCNHAAFPDGGAAHRQDVRELGVDTKDRFRRDHLAKPKGGARRYLTAEVMIRK